MPLRSPKMYFCIFGFQRFVWWPKCTPASSSSFIVSAAIRPSFRRRASAAGPPAAAHCHRLFFRRAAAPPGADRLARGVRDDCLGRVLGVDAHVLLAQVTGPHALLAAPDTELDGDVVGLPSHDLANPRQKHAFAEHAPLHQPLTLPLVAKDDGDLVLLHTGRG